MLLILTLLLIIALVAFAAGRLIGMVRERRVLASEDGNRGGRSRRMMREMRVQRYRDRRAARDAYLDSLGFVSFYQLVVIFTVASIGGLVLETVWVYFDMGVWQKRYGLIWGPFSPLYGLGALMLTLALWKLRKQPVWMVFVVSMVLGSCLEQFAGSVMESGFNATSWSYEHMPDAITKYVSLRMSAIWGFLGCVWCKVALPELLYAIQEPRRAVRNCVTVCLTAFLVVDAAMTLYVAARKDARDRGIPPANSLEVYIDEHYDDGFMSERFENLEFDAEPGVS